ncbi:MAG TPA: hypothetical protein P5333_20820, partial [Caldilinea sp.]|nr:hypothetical protein [Caldilinea sp.]
MNEPSPMAPSPARSNSSRAFMLVAVSIVLALVIFAVGFGAGFGAGHLGQPSTAAGQDDGAADTLRERFPVFWEAMDLLYRDFYGELPAANNA